MAAEHPRSDVVGVKVSVDHFINGARVPSPTTFEDRSPLDWSVQLADVSAGDAVTADAAVTAATAAFPEWAGLGATGRAVILRRLADLVDETVPDIAAVECIELAMRHESLRERLISMGARNLRA